MMKPLNYAGHPLGPNLQRLIEAHPTLFRGAPPTVHSELPAGWYDLVHVLCLGIEEILGEDCPEFQVKQIKEKLGGLRFYFALSGSEDFYIDVHSEDGFETIIKRAASAPAKMASIRQLVELACEGSRATCQMCGSLGAQRVIGGRLTALCDEHHAERIALKGGPGKDGR